MFDEFDNRISSPFFLRFWPSTNVPCLRKRGERKMSVKIEMTQQEKISGRESRRKNNDKTMLWTVRMRTFRGL